MSDEVATPAAPPAAPSATPAASQPAPAATPQSVASPAPSQPAPQSNEPPKERWETILANAREKTRAEVEREYRQRYGKYDQFEQDPWRAVQDWLEQAKGHSIYGQHVQKWAQQFNQPQSVGEEPQPDVPVTDAQGNVTNYVYSAKQLREWHKWNKTQQDQEYNARFGKLEQNAQEISEYRAQVASQQWANQTLTEFRSKPYFKEHEARIREALEEHPEWGDNLHAAYNHVLVSEILPTLSHAEQTKALDNLNQKAAGNTVAPSGSAPARPKFKTFAEAARWYHEHQSEAAADATRGS